MKSRYATDWDRGFPIKNFDCDFVTLVALNRGYRHRRRRTADNETGVKRPEVWVFPVETIRAVHDTSTSWQKANVRRIPDLGSYAENWGLIKRFLEMESPAPSL